MITLFIFDILDNIEYDILNIYSMIQTSLFHINKINITGDWAWKQWY